MSLKKINYSKEEASSIYLTNYRYKILKELQIEETQRKIRNKLLNIEENEIDPVFYKTKIDEQSMSELLSMEFESAKSTSINQSDNYNNHDLISEINENTFKNSIKDLKSENLINENYFVRDAERPEHTDKNNNEFESFNNVDTINNSYDYKNCITTNKLDKKFKKNKYVDLEAECSDEEDSTELCSDNSSFIDDTEINDDVSSIFFAERQKEEEKIIKKLKHKFKNNEFFKIKDLEINNLDIDNNLDDESNDMDNNDFLYENDIKFEKVVYENVPEESEEKFIEEIRFVNLNFF